MLIYGGAALLPGGSRSLDYGCGPLRTLFDDPAFATLPVGIEVPTALGEMAPAVYQALIARQRFTSAELIAAPAVRHLDETRRSMDLTVMSLITATDAQRTAQTVTTLAQTQWLGALLPETGQGQSQMNFLAWPAWKTNGPITSITDLRAALHEQEKDARVLYLDPRAIPPAMLSRLLPEITAHFTLLARHRHCARPKKPPSSSRISRHKERKASVPRRPCKSACPPSP